MKHLKVFEDFTYLTSNQRLENEKYIVGNYVVFNYHEGHDKPYRFIGKVLDNSTYNRLLVEVIDQVKNEQTNQETAQTIKIGQEIEIHVGNVVSQTSNLSKN